ncbi:unnamed protein product [Rotaria sp. Silwood1]|nr:unnamed protein product [Rotaria sp. Silwood1]CAF3374647.1 unnamed protein product [Rotaria sp. Silwood1]CAF3379039.1 unnamed protein product [Rotaria sp. Silwood1]CAF5030914.1 unnamed protein product [Rotaria sp. Silwood1]CAF5128238.1 unnamed protein product [Rotaria sp. Silwood1]
MIRRVVDECRFNHNSYLEKFGLTVDFNEMLMLPARVLSPPKIKNKLSYDDQDVDVIERVEIGKWWLNNRFNKTHEICTWAVVFISPHEPDNRKICLQRDFANRILQVLTEFLSDQ